MDKDLNWACENIARIWSELNYLLDRINRYQRQIEEENRRLKKELNEANEEAWELMILYLYNVKPKDIII